MIKVDKIEESIDILNDENSEEYNEQNYNCSYDINYNNYYPEMISGAFIFCGTFILGANWDYRLIFLILLVPNLILLKHLYTSSSDRTLPRQYP